MKLRIKKLFDNVKEPFKATEGSAAFDVHAYNLEWGPTYSGKAKCFIEDADIDPKYWDFLKGKYTVETVIYSTGLAFDIPEGYCLKFYPRSSIYKKGLLLCNSTGIIDSDYKGEVSLAFYHFGLTSTFDKPPYQIGDRIGQFMLEKVEPVELEFVDDIGTSKRGSGGFGSTGI